MTDFMGIFLSILVILILLMIPVGFILSIIAFVRVSRLEKRIKEGWSYPTFHAPTPKPEQTEPRTPPPSKTPVPPLTQPPVAEQEMPRTLQESVSFPSAPPPPIDTTSVPTPPSGGRRDSIEEWLGGKVFLVLGSLALALAGVFLVKHSIEQGWLSPIVRVTLGIIFGSSLLVIGEVVRKRYLLIASGICASGIAVLFASFLSAVNLYHLIAPSLGFVLMSLTAATAVVLSLHMTSLIAIVGLVGGFFTPVLIQTGEFKPVFLAGYLLILEVALLLVTQKRSWRFVLALTLIFGMGWALGWIFFLYKPSHLFWLGSFILATIFLFTWTTAVGGSRISPLGSFEKFLSSGSSLAGLVTLSFFLYKATYTPMAWTFWGILSVGLLFLVRLKEDLRFLYIPTFLFPLINLVYWATHDPDRTILWTALAFGLLFVLGSFLLYLSGNRRLYAAVGAVVSGLLYFTESYALLRNTFPEVPWSGVVLALGALYLGFTQWAKHPEQKQSLAAFAVGVTFCISLAIPIQWKNQWWTVAWSLEIVPLLILAHRFSIPLLETLAQILGGLVLVRLIFNPFVLQYSTGTHRFFNWLTYGYGIPIISKTAAAWLAFREEFTRRSLVLFSWSAATLGFVYIGLETYQFFHPGRWFADPMEISQFGILWVAWFLYALVIHTKFRREIPGIFPWIPIVFSMVATCFMVFVSFLVHNPLFKRIAVGETPIWNQLIAAYGAPAIMLLLLSFYGPKRPRWVGVTLATFGLTNIFFLITSEIRQYFHGNYLYPGRVLIKENYIYSLAWLILGILILGVGIFRSHVFARRAAMVVIVISIIKVFAFDTSHLHGLFRVVSFFGLGTSLVFIAYIYQRFFKSRE